MLGLIGKKVGMTSYFAEDGKAIACTVIEAGPCFVTQVKTEDTDGYNAVQLGFDAAKEKNTTKPLAGHFKKANVAPQKKVVEFRNFSKEVSLGERISVADVLNEGDKVSVVGVSKGKGFQGVVKRHGFGGVGGRTHGQHNRQRHPGSMGASSFPSRVFKGKKLGGRDGNKTVKVKGLKVLKIYPDKNLLVISGSVPGAKNSYLIIQK